MAEDKKKQSVYLHHEELLALEAEGARLDRSLSWLVMRCVKVGLHELRKLPSHTEPKGVDCGLSSAAIRAATRATQVANANARRAAREADTALGRREAAE